MTRRIRLLRLALASSVLTLALGGSASAGPIGPVCGSCMGTIWDLTATPAGPGDQYVITFSATGTSTSAGFYAYIDGISFKVASSISHYQSVSLLSAPAGSWGPIKGGPLGGPTGCGSASVGHAGKVCLEATDAGAPVPGAGITLLWRFMVDLTGSLVEGQDVSIQATTTRLFSGRGGPRVGTQVFAGELSETLDLTVTQVPEPGLFLLMGAGAFAAVRRRLLQSRVQARS
jgi:hypothetical protein